MKYKIKILIARYHLLIAACMMHIKNKTYSIPMIWKVVHKIDMYHLRKAMLLVGEVANGLQIDYVTIK